MKKYGIGLWEIEGRLAENQYRCEICEENIFGEECVDHNHATGEVRGLLCGKCNTMLGLGKDSSVIFERAATYLKRTGDYSTWIKRDKNIGPEAD